MLTSIFSFELSRWIKSPIYYVYLLVFSSLAFFMFAGTAGFLEEHSPSSDVRERLLNAPYEINFILLYFNRFFLFLVPAVLGLLLFRDYQSGVFHLMYSYPIRKWDYLQGKFLSGFTLVMGVVMATILTIIVAEHLPGLNPAKVGPFRLEGYALTLVVWILPNMLVASLLVFGVILKLRNIFAGFGVIVLLLLLQTLFNNAFSGNGFFIALTDPFGQHTVGYLTRFWTIEELNSKLIPISGVVLWNRILWLSIAIAFAAYTWITFRLETAPPVSVGERSVQLFKIRSTVSMEAGKIPLSAYGYGLWANLKQVGYLASHHLRSILSNWMFLGLSASGVLCVFFILHRVVHQSEMTLLPITRIVLMVPSFFFGVIAMLITFLFTGILVHKERMAKMDALVDASAVPNWVLFISKLMAVWGMQVVLLILLCVIGMGIQLQDGSVPIAWGLYAKQVFVGLGLSLMIWAMAALSIHTMLNQFYLGLFVLILAWMGFGSLPDLGITSKALLFNADQPLEYSDLNGYGNSWRAFLFVKSYWLFFSVVGLLAGYLFHVRGVVESFGSRLGLLKRRFSWLVMALVLVFGVGFLYLGMDIFQKEQQTYTKENMDRGLKDFKTRFSSFSDLEQPRIVKAKLDLDIFPGENHFTAKGDYLVVNKSRRPLDTLLIRTGFDEQTEWDLDRMFKTLVRDSFMKCSLVRLESAIAPGDSMRLTFTIKNLPNQFFKRHSNVLKNGTMLKSDLMPRLGYFLPEKTLDPYLHDSISNHYQSTDSDLVHFDWTISTSEDQTIIAPGILVKEWKSGNRKYAQFKTDRPMKFGFSIHSGRFERVVEMHKGVELEVIHHPGHHYAAKTMIRGLKAALDFNSERFGAYPYSSARVVEFPNSEGTYATSFGNIVPIAENRFIVRADSLGTKVNLPFYIPAHELTHQWWGNQVIPADALGATMLTESITEYLTLCIYQAEFGTEAAQQFLDLQRLRYFSGRAGEHKTEPPLAKVQKDQSYISYGKGAVAFHAMANYLDKGELHAVLEDFMEENRYQTNPYPTTVELLDKLKTAMPDSLHHLVVEYFEKCVVHEVVLESANTSEISDSLFDTKIDISFQKEWVDQEQATDTGFNLLEIQALSADGTPLKTWKETISEGKSSLQFSTKERPAVIKLDPNILLLERNRKNNNIRL